MKKVDICICSQIGMDGSTKCSPTPHNHKLRKVMGSSTISAVDVTACDNHVQVYLALDFQAMAQMACERCCTNVRVPKGSGAYCEPCLEELEGQDPKPDAQRLKEVGYCINRGLVHGCLAYAELNDNLCSYCRNYMKLSSAGPASSSKPILDKPRVKIRLVPSSARSCILTVGCAGTMVGQVRRFSRNSKEELWWKCEICKVERCAERTYAVADPNVTAAQLEAIEDAAIEMALKKEPNNTDMADMSEAIRQTVRGFNQGFE